MKLKFPVITACIMVLCTTIFYACKKNQDSSNTLEKNYQDLPSDISKLAQWYDDQIAQSENIDFVRKNTLDWKNVIKLKMPNGTSVYAAKVFKSSNIIRELNINKLDETNLFGIIKEYELNGKTGVATLKIYSLNGQLIEEGFLKENGNYVRLQKRRLNTMKTMGRSDGLEIGIDEDGEPIVDINPGNSGNPFPSFPSFPSWPSFPSGPGEPHMPNGGGGVIDGSGAAPTTAIDLNFLDRAKYPVLGKIVDGLYQKAKTDKKLMDALKKFSNLTEDKILANLVSGKGPKLTVVNNLPPNVVGRYKDGTNEIKINEIDAKDLNNFSLNTNVSTALEFFFTSLILHEFVHFGNDVSGSQVVSIGAFDAGAQFENAYYRGDVKYDPVAKDIFLVPMPK